MQPNKGNQVWDAASIHKYRDRWIQIVLYNKKPVCDKNCADSFEKLCRNLHLWSGEISRIDSEYYQFRPLADPNYKGGKTANPDTVKSDSAKSDQGKSGEKKNFSSTSSTDYASKKQKLQHDDKPSHYGPSDSKGGDACYACGRNHKGGLSECNYAPHPDINKDSKITFLQSVKGQIWAKAGFRLLLVYVITEATSTRAVTD